MQEKRLLFFGGAFDPPHRGHLEACRSALEAIRPEKALLVPAARPPHKRTAAPFADRLEMCRIAVRGLPGVEVDGCEARLEGAGYTVRALELLAGKYPGHRPYLLLGGDALLSLSCWYRWRDLGRCAALLVAVRRPEDSGRLREEARRLEGFGLKVRLLENGFCPASSSTLRAALERGEDPGPMLPEGVLGYIREHGLYRAAGTLRLACAPSQRGGAGGQ